MSTTQYSAARDHSRESQESTNSNNPSSSSDSKQAHALKHSHRSSHHHGHGSSSRGRSYQPYDASTSGYSSGSGSSGSSTSTSSAEHWPFSVYDIENLDGVIATHLNEITTVLRNVEHHEDHYEEFKEDEQDLLWQIFLARTGACRQRPGREESLAAQGLDGLVSCWDSALRSKRTARKNLVREKHRLDDFVAILFNLLKERDRRDHLARGSRH